MLKEIFMFQINYKTTDSFLHPKYCSINKTMYIKTR